MFEPLKGLVFTMGCPICPKDCKGREMFPATCVLVTLPPGIVAKGFELNRGFQSERVAKRHRSSRTHGRSYRGPNVVTVGVDAEGFGKLLAVVMTIGLGVGIC